ncbi:DUF1833 family protein [Cypionkella sp. TWP1-2-1b2]|uniref:DUF1833 family protein n=1 Tax=Cypionkella sp. TWP1-2-1b2 TaxID=2804675 RepID=UPI003CF3CE9B
MPDPTLSEAIQEAYASAPVDQVIYHTLELWHPAFSAPIRVVRDFNALDARIEAGAARDPSAIVTFVGFAFDIVPPDQTSTGLPQCMIEMDNVDREILAQVDAAVVTSLPITVIYRAYLSDAVSVGPENIPPMELTLLSISATPLRLKATAGFPDLVNLRFPKLDYDLETFPGLQP